MGLVVIRAAISFTSGLCSVALNSSTCAAGGVWTVKQHCGIGEQCGEERPEDLRT
jgi:hypothetical protein